MEIVIFGSFLPASEIGGITTHCDRLAARLVEQEIKVKKVNISPKKKSFISFFKILIKSVYILTGKNQILHFHTSFGNLPFLILSPIIFLLRKKAIVSFHSGHLIRRIEGKFVYKIIFYYAALIAGTIIVMNKCQQQELVAMFPSLGRKIISIHPFIFPLFQENLLQDDCCEKKIFRVASMGAWLRHYGFEDVIKVIFNLAEKNKKNLFSLKIGVALFNIDVDYKKYLLELVMGMEKNAENLKICFEENVKNPLKFIWNADVFVRPSSVDSFGLCVAEAVFLGKPTIATNVCRRVDGVFLYDPHDTEALSAHLIKLYKNFLDENIERPKLDEKEDAFPCLRELYLSL